MQLIERLKETKPLFEQIRSAFGVTEAVGFASLPDTHSIYSLASIVPTYARMTGYLFWRKQMLYYSGKPISSYGSPEVKLTSQHENRVIVPANYSLPHTRLISVYQIPYTMVETASLLNCSQDIYAGLFGHEFSHWLEVYNKVPFEISDGLDTILQPLQQRQEIMLEVEVDLIAARLGLKDSILATLDFIDSYFAALLNSRHEFKFGECREGIAIRKQYVERNS